MDLAKALTGLAWSAVGGDATATTAHDVVFTGTGGLPSVFAVTDLAAAAVATAALSVADLLSEEGIKPAVEVDRRLSAMWFRASLRPLGWELPPLRGMLTGDYLAQDGWIRLHANAPCHRSAVERVLGVQADRDAAARAVVGWSKADLEQAVIEAGGCAAEMRSVEEWRDHAQGRAVRSEPLVHMHAAQSARAPRESLSRDRPLRGVRVLDLTRVLAGPVASRFLAGYGADVLRIDPPDWDEPGVVPEVTLGKRCARLDLRRQADRASFEQLLMGADVVLHGYRPGALDHLGFDAVARRHLAPGLIDVSLDAYGWSGPWAQRRGFDSLVQMSSGIADYGMRRAGAQRPVPLPVQALDHATGYLAAAAAIRGLAVRMRQSVGTEARLSLARIAQVLVEHPPAGVEMPLAAETGSDHAPEIESTDWGAARRLLPPLRIEGIPVRWDYPASKLGSVPPQWRGG